MSTASAQQTLMESTESPRHPFDPPEGVSWIKVLRKDSPQGKFEPCTEYDEPTRTHNDRLTVPGEPIPQFILDRWGSGLYYVCWFDSQNRPTKGRSKEMQLDDPARPQRPKRYGGPSAPPKLAAVPAAPPGLAGVAPPPAQTIADYVQLQQAQMQAQMFQLQLAQLERDRDRERREWEEKRERERREWEEDRIRLREQEARRVEQERAEWQRRIDAERRDAEDRRRREDEERVRERRAERERYERMMEERERDRTDLRREDFESLLDDVKEELRAEMEKREKGLLSQIFGAVKDFAPMLAPLVAGKMGMPLPAAPIAAAPPATLAPVPPPPPPPPPKVA